MKNIIITIAAVIIGIICTFYSSPDTQGTHAMQQQISEKIIRFHVRANSDSEDDQSLKLLVKDAIVAYLSDSMKDSPSKAESAAYINEHLSDIERIALDTIKEAGYNYTVHAYMVTEYFPTKSYGDVTVPCGEYDAFRVDIGANAGKNWWCILYPPLCFVQGSYGIATDESKSLLKNVLDEDEFDYISNASSDDIGFSFKFLSLFE